MISTLAESVKQVTSKIVVQSALTGMAFADQKVRPILDRVVLSNERGYSGAMVNMDGYLPTHLSSRSHPQGPDPLWNAEHCRNRRIFMDAQTEEALRSDAEFILETYRLDLGGGRYRPVKSVFVPLRLIERGL